MNNNARMFGFGLALLILTLIVAVILGLMAGPTNPITWLLVAVLVLIPFVHRKLSSTRYFKWKEEYSVGIASIDSQHKKLIHLINQLQTAIDYSTGEIFEREALNELVEYTITHFRYEEKLMRENEYPEYEAHQAQHNAMVDKVNLVLEEYAEDADEAMTTAVDYLKTWLIEHINGTDKQYSEFLISKGVN
ncbi:MAG: hemerythrin family protein [Gammaproteobacteria bacterium]|nr:hemerythrin family protein [Gammaproteobacteria bacterium]